MSFVETCRNFAPDLIIIGGGSAGCVLASRLTERAWLKVLLIESGQDVPPDAVPETLRTTYPGKTIFSQEYFQPGLNARFGAAIPGSNRPRAEGRYDQARVIGGGSAVNGLLGNRGLPGDYDEWAAAGAAGWGWGDVLPWFRKLETDRDFGGAMHGQDGPIQISRLAADRIAGVTGQVEDLLSQAGHARIDDQNATFGDGFMRPALTATPEAGRSSAAAAYLSAAVRARANLMLATGQAVRRLVIAGGRVTGVELDGGQIAAAQVIVSAGAILTPALLMRSGLGPAAVLRTAGLDVVHDLQGVGRNLLEHPSLGISVFVRSGFRQREQDRNHVQLHLRFSSGLEGVPAGDMRMALLSRSAWHAVGTQLATFFFWVDKSYSKGEVTLDPVDPFGPPQVDFRLLSDPRDCLRLMQGFRRMAALAQDSALDRVRDQVFPTAYTARVRAVSLPTRANRLKTGLFAAMLDLAGPMRERLIRSFIAQRSLAELLADEHLLLDHVNDMVRGVWHAAGTCRMGAEDDPLAVTDAEGRVRGVAGLRICDASLMPTIPCANTNLPTLMIAEKIAAAIVRDPYAA